MDRGCLRLSHPIRAMEHDCSFLSDVLSSDRISIEEADRTQHAGDFGTPEDRQVTPAAVVWPESTDEVARVLTAAHARGVPVTPFAAGTSLEGNATPVFGGIVVDLTRLTGIVEVRPDDFQIDVRAGTMGTDIDEAVAQHGLFFPPLPSSGDLSTIGGMIANDASGMGTVKYGEIADWLLGLEVVLADGTVVTTGSRAIKSSSGYNLTDLFVGSEGTLGIITRATLELAGVPEQIRGGRAIFSTLEDAADAVFDAVRSGVDVAKIELVDGLSATMANHYLGADLPDAPMTFLEFHANHGVEREVDFCRSIFESHDVERFEMADREAMDELWRARRELAYAVRSYDPALEPIHPGDVTVPISAYPEIIRFVKDLASEAGVLAPCFGHAGDGNVHYTVMVDPSDPESVATGERVYADVVKRAIELGGTATGEHGIGLGKREYLELEHGVDAVELMRSIKRAYDSTDVLNPGKIFPETMQSGGRVRLEGDE